MKINSNNIYLFPLSLLLSIVMICGVKQTESDFATYRRIIENGMIENIKATEPLAHFVFIELAQIVNSQLATSMISIFIYLSTIYLIHQIGRRYISMPRSMQPMLLIAIGLSFPVLSLSQSILRQGLAVVVMLIMLSLVRNKYTKVLLFSAAVMFHNSIAIFLPMLFITHIKKTDLKSLFYFSFVTLLYLYLLRYFFINPSKIDFNMSISDYVSFTYFLISIMALFALSIINNLKNTWFPYIYLNSLMVLIVNYDLNNIDRFMYLPWSLVPILMFKFLKNPIFMFVGTFFWVFINILYSPSRYY